MPREMPPHSFLKDEAAVFFSHRHRSCMALAGQCYVCRPTHLLPQHRVSRALSSGKETPQQRRRRCMSCRAFSTTSMRPSTIAAIQRFSVLHRNMRDSYSSICRIMRQATRKAAAGQQADYISQCTARTLCRAAGVIRSIRVQNREHPCR